MAYFQTKNLNLDIFEGLAMEHFMAIWSILLPLGIL
jgi:hypothetical protein